MIRERVLKFGITAAVVLAAGMFTGEESTASAAENQPVIAGAEKTMYLDGKDTIAIQGKHIVSVTYASSKSNIATISKKGVVLPKKKGTTRITATVVYKKKASGKKYTKKLNYRLSVLGKAEEYFKFYKRDSGNASNYEVAGLTEKGKEMKKLYIPGYVGKHKVKCLGGNAVNDNSNIVSLHLSDVLTRIDGNAVSGCQNLEKVYFGKGFSNIGYGSFFSGCPSLKQIILDERNESMCVEDGVLFDKGKRHLLCYPAQKQGSRYTIPEGVEYIGADAFENCRNIKEIVLSDSVFYLGNRCFAGSGLTAMTIPDTVDCWGEGTFADCDFLSEVQLSKRFTYLAGNTFSNCVSLKSIMLPVNISSFENSAFRGCTRLEQIEVAAANKYLCSVDGVVYSDQKAQLYYYPLGKKETHYQVLEGTQQIGNRAFRGCTALKSVELPESMTAISSYAFYQSAIEEVSLPDSVTVMESYAFAECKKLSKVKLSKGLTKIPFEAFAGCTGIAEISLPEEVISVNAWAFEGCSNLTRFSVEEKNTSFAVVDGVLYSKSMQTLCCYPMAKAEESFTVPKSVTKIGERAFAQAKWLKKISLTEQVSSLGENAFAQCESLETVKLSNRLKKIPYAAFEECSALSAIKLPASIEEIESEAFYGCTSLTGIKIPNEVTMIGYEAFADCEKLKTVEIGSKVNLISYRAFQNCKGLKKIIVKTKKLVSKSIRKDAFKDAGANKGKKLVVDVPDGKITAYRRYFQAGGLSKNATVK